MISMTMSVQFVVSDDWCHLNQSYSSVLFEEELKEMYEWSVFGTQRLVPGSRCINRLASSLLCFDNKLARSYLPYKTCCPIYPTSLFVNEQVLFPKMYEATE